jgi:hypothetical protein
MSAAGSILDLSFPQLALALLLVGVVMAISVRQGLGIGGDLVVGSLRAIVQLYLVGLILAVVFHAARIRSHTQAGAADIPGPDPQWGLHALGIIMRRFPF